MREDEALKAMTLFEGAIESERISKKALMNWVVSQSYHYKLVFPSRI